MSTVPTTVPSGIPDLPATVSADLPVTRTSADTGTLLDRWAVGDEKKLREAQAYIAQIQTKRNLALAAVDQVLEKAGVDPTVRDALIENATALRTVLAPFDVSVK